MYMYYYKSGVIGLGVRFYEVVLTTVILLYVKKYLPLIIYRNNKYISVDVGMLSTRSPDPTLLIFKNIFTIIFFLCFVDTYP